LPQRASEAGELLLRAPSDDFAAARAHDAEAVPPPDARWSIHGAPHKVAAHVISLRPLMVAVQRSHVARMALPALLVAALVLCGRYLGYPQANPTEESTPIRTPA